MRILDLHLTGDAKGQFPGVKGGECTLAVICSDLLHDTMKQCCKGAVCFDPVPCVALEAPGCSLAAYDSSQAVPLCGCWSCLQLEQQLEGSAAEVQRLHATCASLGSALERQRLDAGYMRSRATALRSQRPRLSYMQSLSLSIPALA